jgi:hypothetical protein
VTLKSEYHEYFCVNDADYIKVTGFTSSGIQFTQCNPSSCKLCDTYPAGDASCTECDDSNKLYNFPQAFGVNTPCIGAALGDLCLARNITNSCSSCDTINPEKTLTRGSAFTFNCDCGIGFWTNDVTFVCEPCTEWCKIQTNFDLINMNLMKFDINQAIQQNIHQLK